MNDLDLRRRRLRRAHHLIRAELAVAFGAPAVAGLFFIAAPGFLFEPEPTSVVARLSGAGIVGVVVGIVWMLRLSRPDPEGGQRTWRYRDF